jgi:hypothetical protein
MSTTGNGPFEGNQVGWTNTGVPVVSGANPNTGVGAIQTPSVNGGYPTVTYNGVPYTNDVAGYTGYVNWLQKLGPTQYLGINSTSGGTAPSVAPGEYYNNLQIAQDNLAAAKKKAGIK